MKDLLNLPAILEQLIEEAESPDGVTGDCARAAVSSKAGAGNNRLMEGKQCENDLLREQWMQT